MKPIPSCSQWVRRCRILTMLPAAVAALSLLALNPVMAQGHRAKPNASALIAKALPAGVKFQNATPEQIADAIAKLLVAHRANPELVLGIVATAVELAAPNQIVAVAQGVAKAFGEAKSLTAEAPRIAKIFGESIARKEGDTKELGKIMGSATAEIVKALDKSESALITQTVTEALVSHPQIDYTAAAYETVMDAVRQIDIGNTLEDQITDQVVKSVSKEVADQIVPPLNPQEVSAAALTTNPTQTQNNTFNTPDRPVESTASPL